MSETENNPAIDKIDKNKLEHEILTNQKVRIAVTSESHMWFFATYFADYLQCPFAGFHRTFFDITEDENCKLAVITAFRGSGKSSIFTMSYPLWAILGVQQKKFVMIISRTQIQARIHFANIKRELESNDVLRQDMGPFKEDDEWNAVSVILTNHNARIMAVSADQAIRGIRHGAMRPDLIICDDVEDTDSVRTREGRNKTFDWFTGEVLPIGDTYTKRIVVGNLLHEDSLLMRLKDRIKTKELDGSYNEWPIMRGRTILWPGKFSDESSINQLCKSIGNNASWQREYMLRIVSDDEQVIKRQWIQYYDAIPDSTFDQNEYVGTFISVDLAISQKETADYTAIIPVHVFGFEQKNRKYYIDNNFINKRMTYNQTLDTIRALYEQYQSASPSYDQVWALVEQVQYQAAVVQHLEELEMNVKGIRVHGDKRSRLSLTSSLFERKAVFFSGKRKSAEIVQQLTGFGIEKHDDLADAISMALNFVQINVQVKEYMRAGVLPASSVGFCYKKVEFVD